MTPSFAAGWWARMALVEGCVPEAYEFLGEQRRELNLYSGANPRRGQAYKAAR